MTGSALGRRSSTSAARPSHPDRGASRLLAELLDRPDLVADVRAMSGRELVALVDRLGLEDAGEIVALATTEQIAAVFDADLWRAERAGEAERFDARRFLLWLEVLLEAGDGYAAGHLAALPEDTLALALHALLLVIRIDHLAVALAADEAEDAPAWARRAARRPEVLEKMLEGCLYEEIGEHQIMPRHHDGWDAVLDVVLALDRDHHDLLHHVLERCAAMTTETIEDAGGITRLLRAEETLAADVAAEREQRRAAQGYVAPADARAFLALARLPLDPADVLERDVISRTYLQPWKDAGAPGAPRRRRSRVPQRARGGQPPFAEAMRALRDHDPRLYATRAEEVAYLVNVLVAGRDVDGRRLRPAEALEMVIATCSDGLVRSAAVAAGATDGVEAVRARPADVLFRLGTTATAPGARPRPRRTAATPRRPARE